MKIKDKVNQIIGISHDEINLYISLTVLDLRLHEIENSLSELYSQEVSKKFKELIDVVQREREKLWEYELKNEGGKEWK